MNVHSDQRFMKKRVAIRKIYTKSISFEIFQKTNRLDNIPHTVNFEYQTSITHVMDHCYEVSLAIQLLALEENIKLFNLDFEQAGLFEIEGWSQDRLCNFLNQYCIQGLYLHAKNRIAQLITQAGFSSIILQHLKLDFASELYSSSN